MFAYFLLCIFHVPYVGIYVFMCSAAGLVWQWLFLYRSLGIQDCALNCCRCYYNFPHLQPIFHPHVKGEMKSKHHVVCVLFGGLFTRWHSFRSFYLRTSVRRQLRTSIRRYSLESSPHFQLCTSLRREKSNSQDYITLKIFKRHSLHIHSYIYTFCYIQNNRI